MENTHIIFIHGLAAKPSEAVLFSLWKKALLENIQLAAPELAQKMLQQTELFQFAYWANAIPDHIEYNGAQVDALAQSVADVIAIREQAKDGLHIGKVGWTSSQVKKFGMSIVNALSTAITVKDNVIHEHMREVRLYRDDQYIADRVRATLEDKLRQAWDAGKRVVIMGHSMGTFITYDVLWRFFQRSEPAYKRYREKQVDLFISMGSPLGDAALRDFMLIERWEKLKKSKEKTERSCYYPLNLKRWYNFSAYGDIVCHDATLEDDFFAGMKDTGSYKTSDLRDYVKLYNPFINPDGKPNPHKSFGYLVQPKLAQKLAEFF